MSRILLLILLCCCWQFRVAISSETRDEKILPEKQQGPVEVHWYSTRDSVFELHTFAQLRGFAELVNAGIDFHQQEIRLASDIFLNDTTGWAQWEKNPPIGHEQWVPIGQEDKPFCGTFDGQGHSVYGMYINRGMESYYQGFFGLVLDGRIQNVHVKASFIKAHDHVGGIAGMMGYTSEIRGCTFEGCVMGMGHMVGGIVGKAEEYNRIIDCGNLGDIQGQRRVGGIAGSFAFGELYNCFNRGHITGRHEEVGGLVGVLLGGRFNGQSADAGTFEWAKGVVREVEKRRQIKARELRYTLANNYNIGAVTGEDKIGGLIGAFMGFPDNDTTTNENGIDWFEIAGLRQVVANAVRSATKRGTYFANCYNTGKISGRFPVYTDGLVGHYGWRWQPAVYLLDERGDSCYWSDSSVVVAKIETWRLPRDRRSFDRPQEIYSIRSPKVFEEVVDSTMQSETFSDKLNEWVDRHGLPFRRWRIDSEDANGGYPVLDRGGGQP